MAVIKTRLLSSKLLYDQLAVELKEAYKEKEYSSQ
jgi:hypothetical protein